MTAVFSKHAGNLGPHPIIGWVAVTKAIKTGTLKGSGCIYPFILEWGLTYTVMLTIALIVV